MTDHSRFSVRGWDGQTATFKNWSLTKTWIDRYLEQWCNPSDHIDTVKVGEDDDEIRYSVSVMTENDELTDACAFIVRKKGDA